MEYSFIEKKINRKRIEGFSFLMIQVTVCVIILLFAVLLKVIDGDTFDKLKRYYNSKINESIVFGSEGIKYNDIIKATFCREKEELKLDFVNRTCGTTAPNIDFSVPFCNPVKSGKVTSKFGMRKDPIAKEIKHHSGIDIGVNKNEEICSVLPGTVKEVFENDSYGRYIVIDHGNGIKTLYAHCESILKNVDDKVFRGETIALAGSSGQSTGNHLHLELMVNDIKYNPEPLINL